MEEAGDARAWRLCIGSAFLSRLKPVIPLRAHDGGRASGRRARDRNGVFFRKRRRPGRGHRRPNSVMPVRLDTEGSRRPSARRTAVFARFRDAVGVTWSCSQRGVGRMSVCSSAREAMACCAPSPAPLPSLRWIWLQPTCAVLRACRFVVDGGDRAIPSAGPSSCSIRRPR